MKCTSSMAKQGMCSKGKFYDKAKQEKSGAYNETTLWINNDQPLYNQKWAIYKNYCRKIKKGKFDRNLAKKGFRNLTNQANKVYKKQIGESLPLEDRRVAENVLVKEFFSDVRDEGGCDAVLNR